MQRVPMTYGGIASEQQATETKSVVSQAVNSVAASRPTNGMGSMFDFTAHKAALPAFAFLLIGGGLLFYLIYKSHLSLSASLGRG